MKGSLERGIKFYNTKRYEQALNEFHATGIEPSENNDLAYYTGLSLTQLEKYDDALMYLEMVVNSHSSLLHVYQSRMILGYIYAETNRFKLAEFEYIKLLEAGMESTQIYSSLGYIYYSQKKIQKSLDSLQKAIKLDPMYPNALNSLGFIYAQENIDMEKALWYCKKAVKYNSNNPAYLDSLGWAYFKNNNLYNRLC